MIPSPIFKALSTIRTRQVAHLLMGGQACVLYGAAEFSRDLDLVLLSDPVNLDRLRAALGDLKAQVIAVPPFRPEFLDEGLAVHFRCAHPDVAGLRIDIMTRMRGVVPFPDLWKRRTTFDFGEETVDVLSLPDLIAAKKTQRDPCCGRRPETAWKVARSREPCARRRTQSEARMSRTGDRYARRSRGCAKKHGGRRRGERTRADLARKLVYLALYRPPCP